MEMAQQSISTNKSTSEHRHLLSDKWVLWAHLPHDTDWTLKSYINIVEFETAEEVIAVINTIPPTMIKNCMLFKESYKPMLLQNAEICIKGLLCFYASTRSI